MATLEAPRDAWAGLRLGGALLLLVPGADGAWRVPITRRARHLKGHRGQCSLPGGRQEPGEDVLQTALRETHEEIGVEPGAVRVLGFLGRFYVHVSLFHLGVAVGTTADMPRFAPNPGEVDHVFLPRLDDLYRQYRARGYDHLPEAVKNSKPDLNFDVADGAETDVVWGATGRVITEFCARVLDPLLGGEDNGDHLD